MQLHIDNKKCTAKPGQTVLQVALENDIFIPNLCHGEGLAPAGSCGLCIVETEGNPRLLRACATAATDGMIVNTKSARVLDSRKTLLELTISAHSGDCKAPCQLSCPAQSDCQGYIALIAAGKLREAVELMKEAHPFPASVARICPRPCETECRRKLADEPVNIAGLKRFAADWDLFDAGDTYIPPVAQSTGKRVAIVGGGPAGLTAAYFLRRAGNDVSVFEKMPKMGGLLRYGIPEYRLPKKIVDAELDVLEKMGIQFSNGVELGRDITLESLQKDYDSVIIAVGAGLSKPIWCEGENAEGVFGGIDFLKAVACNNPPKIGKRVVVVGGSNTAMDAARTAVRLGAEATVAYRRTRDEMPAEKIEVEEAIAEGVKFAFLTAPMEIVTGENGRVKGIRLQKMALGEPDESGRRSPVPIEGGEEWLDADTIIAAIGQDVSVEGLNPLDNLKVDKDFRTEAEGVFAIGDATKNSAYAIEAIGHGRVLGTHPIPGTYTEGQDTTRSHLQSAGGSIEITPKILVRDKKTAEDFSATPKSPRQDGMLLLAPQGERPSFDAVQEALTPQQAANEASRCLSCGCADFYECKLLKLANMYDANPQKFAPEHHKKPEHEIDRGGFNFHRDMNKCVLCGLCVRTCDKASEKAKRYASAKDKELIGAAISQTGRGFETIVSAAFGQHLHNRDECTQCGNCAAACPVGALTEVSPLPKHLVTREEITESTCTNCGGGCAIKIATKAGAILRCLPQDGVLMCEKGRFAFRNYGDALTTPMVSRFGLLRRASWQDAAKAVREGLNIIKAQYGAESIGIAVSARNTVEDIAAILDYAAKIGTPHIFCAHDSKQEADIKFEINTQGLIDLGVSLDTAKYLDKIRTGEIKGLIVFGAEQGMPALIENPPEFLVVQTAYASHVSAKSGGKSASIDVLLPAPAYGEVSGHVVSKDGKKLPVNPALPAACGYQVREAVRLLLG